MARRRSRPTDATATGEASDAVRDSSVQSVSWEIGIPLLSNRRMLGGITKVFAISWLVMGGLLGFIFAAQQEFDAILPVLGMTAAACAGLFVLSLLIMALVFGNRLRARFTVSNRGVYYETIDRPARAIVRAGVVLGALTKSPQALGAGLIGLSQETMNASWKGRFTAMFDDRARVITLRNRWRNLMHIYCTSENYQQVADLVRHYMQRHRTASRVAGRSPIPGALLRTVLVVLACLPLFELPYPFSADLLLLILLLAFALATVWLINLFAWVVLGCIVLIAGTILMQGFLTHQFKLINTYTYTGFGSLDGGEWSEMALAFAGLGYLAWMSYQALHGRWMAALLSDWGDLGE